MSIKDFPKCYTSLILFCFKTLRTSVLFFNSLFVMRKPSVKKQIPNLLTDPSNVQKLYFKFAKVKALMKLI